MRLLVLGGSRFLGRHVVDAALGRGHGVTVFNRGNHNTGLPDGVETLVGDRDGDLEPLRGREWDAVVDTSGYVPRVVRASADLLSGAAGHYVFVSSLSVYAGYGKDGLDESGPVGTLEDTTVEKVTGETYGPLKAMCEREVETAFAGRAAVARAGLIVGPRDDIRRFTYWVQRVARGGAVLAPGEPDRHLQLVDVRDLAEWMVRLSEDRRAGVFNATGPERPLTMGGFLDEARRVSGSDARFVWASDEFLAEHGVAPWTDMPLYLPKTDEYLHFFDVSVERAVEAGLTFRPLAETIADTLAWTEPPIPKSSELVPPDPGLPAAREAELLAALDAS